MITYRDVAPSDFKDLHENFLSYIDELKENPDLGLVLMKEKPTAAEELDWFARTVSGIERGNTVTTVAVNEGGRVVGLCDVRRVSPGTYGSHKGELGIAIRREYRGKGIGTELLRLTLEKCRGEFEVIQLRVFSINLAKKLYTRFGFTSYGHDPYGVYRNGKYFEEDLMLLKLSH